MTPTGKKWAWGIGLTLLVGGGILVAVNKDKLFPKKTTKKSGTGKSMEGSEEQVAPPLTVVKSVKHANPITVMSPNLGKKG